MLLLFLSVPVAVNGQIQTIGKCVNYTDPHWFDPVPITEKKIGKSRDDDEIQLAQCGMYAYNDPTRFSIDCPQLEHGKVD